MSDVEYAFVPPVRRLFAKRAARGAAIRSMGGCGPTAQSGSDTRAVPPASTTPATSRSP